MQPLKALVSIMYGILYRLANVISLNYSRHSRPSLIGCMFIWESGMSICPYLSMVWYYRSEDCWQTVRCLWVQLGRRQKDWYLFWSLSFLKTVVQACFRGARKSWSKGFLLQMVWLWKKEKSRLYYPGFFTGTIPFMYSGIHFLNHFEQFSSE